MNLSPNAHVLLAKYPEPGAVKTRLVNGIEENGFNGLKDTLRTDGSRLTADEAFTLAADLYRAFLTDRFRAHGKSACNVYLGTSQPERTEAFRQITGPDILYHTVHGANMGEMMFRIFQDLLQHHRKVIISGSDFPYLPESVVERVFQQLDIFDIVLVPAYDGAYNLIGMSRLHNIFTISKWSSGSELQETIQLLQNRSIKHTIIDDIRLLDIDTIEDLRLLSQTLREDQAPVTFAKLRSIHATLRLI